MFTVRCNFLGRPASDAGFFVWHGNSTKLFNREESLKSTKQSIEALESAGGYVSGCLFQDSLLNSVGSCRCFTVGCLR